MNHFIRKSLGFILMLLTFNIGYASASSFSMPSLAPTPQGCLPTLVQLMTTKVSTDHQLVIHEPGRTITLKADEGFDAVYADFIENVQTKKISTNFQLTESHGGVCTYQSIKHDPSAPTLSFNLQVSITPVVHITEKMPDAAFTKEGCLKNLFLAQINAFKEKSSVTFSSNSNPADTWALETSENYGDFYTSFMAQVEQKTIKNFMSISKFEHGVCHYKSTTPGNTPGPVTVDLSLIKGARI